MINVILSIPFFSKEPQFKQLPDIFFNKIYKKQSPSIPYHYLTGLSMTRDTSSLSYNKDYVRKGLVFKGILVVALKRIQGYQVKILSENINKAYNLKTWVKKNKKKPLIAFLYLFFIRKKLYR